MVQIVSHRMANVAKMNIHCHFFLFCKGNAKKKKKKYRSKKQKKEQFLRANLKVELSPSKRIFYLFE